MPDNPSLDSKLPPLQPTLDRELTPVPLRQAGRLLVALRQQSRLSQTAFAERLGMKQAAIARWESTEYRTVSLERMAAVADALGAVIMVHPNFW